MKTDRTLIAACSVLFLTRPLSQSAFAQQVSPTPWTIAAPMPGASSRLQAAFVPETGKVYTISGFATDRVGIYDAANNSWTTGTPLPSQLDQSQHRLNGFLEKFGRAVLNGKIYVIGGDDRFESNPNPLDTNVYYDTATDSWVTNLMPLPAPKRAGAAAVNLKVNKKSKIYVIGGKGRKGKNLTKVDIYDPNTDTWDSDPQPQLPSPRAGVAAGAIGGKIYLFGGAGITGNRLTSGLIFDPADLPFRWQEGKVPDMPTFGTGHSTVLNGKLFVVGCGPDSSKVLVYDPSSNSWDETYPDLPTNRPDGGVTSDGVSQLYAVGGGQDAPLDELDILDVGQPGAPPPQPVITNSTDLDILSTNEVFDPLGSNIWRSKTRMPTARAGFGIAEAGGRIYVGGGQVLRECSPAVGNLEAYDPGPDPAKPGSWTILPPMPTPRLHLSAATVNGKIYFIGGQLKGGRGNCAGDSPVGIVESYDPSKGSAPDAWTTDIAPMNFPRYDTGIGVIDSKIYVIGGNDGTDTVGKVEMFDPADGPIGKWTTKRRMPTARLFPAVGVVNNILYAIGGSDPVSGRSDALEAYDPTSDTWTSRTSLPTPRRFKAGVGVVNNIIYVFGGADGFRELSTNEAYDPSIDEWSTAPAMPTARFGLGGAVAGDRLYATGGLLQGIATVGQQFIYQITATNHPTSFGLDPSSPPLPTGLKINAKTGLIFGIPITPSHDNLVTVTATANSVTGTASLFFSVQPFPTSSPSPPQIVSSTSATGKVDHAFGFQVLTKHASSSAVFDAGGLPSGLSIDPNTGLISGSSSSEGNFAVSLSVTDPEFAGSPDLRTTNNILQLTFIEDSDGPIITSSENATLVPGQFFSYKITADTANANTFSYIGTDGQKNGALPSGLTFDGVDTISGVYNGGATSNLFPQGDTFWTNARSRFPSGLIGPPDTITIRPRLIANIQSATTDPSGTGTRPLNFVKPPQ